MARTGSLLVGRPVLRPTPSQRPPPPLVPAFTAALAISTAPVLHEWAAACAAPHFPPHAPFAPDAFAPPSVPPPGDILLAVLPIRIVQVLKSRIPSDGLRVGLGRRGPINHRGLRAGLIARVVRHPSIGAAGTREHSRPPHDSLPSEPLLGTSLERGCGSRS